MYTACEHSPLALRIRKFDSRLHGEEQWKRNTDRRVATEDNIGMSRNVLS